MKAFGRSTMAAAPSVYIAGVSNIRSAGRIRSANRFVPAREMILESIKNNWSFNFSIQLLNKVVTQYYDSVCAFKLKTQLVGGDAAHFAPLENVCVTQHVADMKRFKEKLMGLLREFEQRFQISGQLEKDFKVFCSPFTENDTDLPVNIQLEIIDLQCDSDLKEKFAAAVQYSVFLNQ